MCDIWKTAESRQFTIADLQRRLDDIRELGVEWLVFTGGEALMNPGLFEMASVLRAIGVRVTVLTSGLLLGRYANEIVAHVDDVIVSLDGPRGIHDRIRGVIGAYDQLAGGLRRIQTLAPEYPVSARCTVQRANHAALVDTAQVAQSLGLRSISFLAADVSSDAFNHTTDLVSLRSQSLLLTPREISRLEAEIGRLSDDPIASMIAETPEKLRRIVEYFRALTSRSEPAAPQCNAPWVSAVLDYDGAVRPCFFHPPIGNVNDSSLREALNSENALAFRGNLDIASNPVCRRCVCSLHRGEAVA
jgi:MoaA/NifB/PqqE/SkfB family radical SAM enzyme